MDRGSSCASCQLCSPYVPAEAHPEYRQRIVAEELGLVLAWAVWGAARDMLARGHFPDLPSSPRLVSEWGARPTGPWLGGRIGNRDGLAAVLEASHKPSDEPDRMMTSFWAFGEGYSPNAFAHINNFFPARPASVYPARIRDARTKHSGGFLGCVGMRLKPWVGRECRVGRVPERSAGAVQSGFPNRSTLDAQDASGVILSP